MTRKVLAHITDAHLGQKILLSGIPGANNNMSYVNEPEAHKHRLKVVLNDVASREIPHVVFGGDIGTREANKWFFDAIGEYKFRLQMVLGNHGTLAEVSKHYDTENLDPNHELYYVHEDSQVKHIFLDTSSNRVSRNQVDWLKQEIDTQKKTILFVHHPILRIETPVDKLGAALNGRDQLRDVLKESEREVTIFCGHYHMQDEVVHENIRQFVTPAVSYQIKKRAETIEIDEGCVVIDGFASMMPISVPTSYCFGSTKFQRLGSNAAGCRDVAIGSLAVCGVGKE
jgi:3',5'-cyclic-AMP phosphodiesterase